MKNRVNALKNNEKKQPTNYFPRALRETTQNVASRQKIIVFSKQETQQQ